MTDKDLFALIFLQKYHKTIARAGNLFAYGLYFYSFYELRLFGQQPTSFYIDAFVGSLLATIYLWAHVRACSSDPGYLFSVLQGKMASQPMKEKTPARSAMSS